jgi:hypothetical protein
MLEHSPRKSPRGEIARPRRRASKSVKFANMAKTARQRRWLQRSRDGRGIAPVEYDQQITAKLVALHALRECDIDDRRAIAAAIAAVLRSVVL